MISRLVSDLNDENEGYRKMVVDAIDKVLFWFLRFNV